MVNPPTATEGKGIDSPKRANEEGGVCFRQIHRTPINTSMHGKGVDLGGGGDGGIHPSNFFIGGDEYLIMPHFFICLTKFCFFKM